MSAADVESAPPPPPPPALPEYLLNPNAVLKDASKWRYGRAPDYSNTRTVFEKTKKMTHEAASLPSLVENLVKNWEIEASFKPDLSDWRTIDHANYSFAINGGPAQTAEYMLEVGTYNAIIAPNEFYSPANSSFASSHKTFKRMMPTFAWEVLEVYSGPPTVAFKWRHWGQMKNDYVGFNDKGEKITAKAHQGSIEIEGVTVAHVDDQVRLQKVETWFDPLEMFRQIAPNGIVNKEVRSSSDDHDDDDDHHDHEESAGVAENNDGKNAPEGSKEEKSEAANKEETEVKRGTEETKEEGDKGVRELTKDFDQKSTLLEDEKKSPPNEEIPPPLESSSSSAAPAAPAVAAPAPAPEEPAPEEPAPAEPAAAPAVPPATTTDTTPLPGDAIAATPSSDETRRVHEEMSRITARECPFLNQE